MSINLKELPLNKVSHATPELVREMGHLGIHNVFDLLTFFPKAHHFRQLNQLVTDDPTVNSDFGYDHMIKIQIKRTDKVQSKRCSNGALFTRFPARILGTDHEIHIYAFGFEDQQAELKDNLDFEVEGMHLLYQGFHGSIDKVQISTTKGRECGYIRAHEPLIIKTIGRYTAKHGVPQSDIRNMVFTAYVQYRRQIKNTIPKPIRRKYALLDRQFAIFQCHYPTSDDDYQLGTLSEKFYELYAYAMRLQKLHAKRSRAKGLAIIPDKKALYKFKNSLPYELTDDQKESVKDILYDMSKPFRMARLLQGDVGSGKTVVSAFGILCAIQAGYQTALMIPTTVLGGQHYQTFTEMFKGLGVRIALLTGKTRIKEKRKILKKLRDGQIDLIIGTEALYQKSTQYQHLGLVVVDEQHRFGVRQRKLLERKTKGCNILSMTATPIPRTLATAMYKAMDISQIRHLPKGRKPIKTKYLAKKYEQPSRLAKLLASTVKKGGQAFVVAKLVRPSKKSKKVSDAVSTYQHLKQALPDDIKVGLVHGRMKDREKDAVLQKFAEQKFQVLVATSVVEVGVDIPHANNMTILDADRYGLAQLHQLRGRVGRNSEQAYCYLIGDPKSKTAKKRLQVMEKTDNGFKLAEEDLKIRHSGNIFGSNQSGLPEFPLANLSEDLDVHVLQVATQEAGRVLRDAKE